jgi:hypothetical protein
MSRHVAGAPRVRIRPPGATEGLVTLKHQEVLDAGLAQLDRYPETTEPRANDGDAHIAQPAGRAVHLHTVGAVTVMSRDDRPSPAAIADAMRLKYA